MVSKVNEKYALILTPDEVYTLQILLGFVASDSECYSVQKKLVDLTDEEMDTYDFDRVVFSVEGYGYTNKIETGEDESIVIRLV
jgi:hypothetical protein